MPLLCFFDRDKLIFALLLYLILIFAFASVVISEIVKKGNEWAFKEVAKFDNKGGGMCMKKMKETRLN